MELTTEIMDRLSRPFPAAEVQWKPQATTKDKTRALAVAYVEPRAYYDRLNEVAGADWSDSYEVISGGTVILCRLTVAGVTRSDVGEAPANDENTATSAIAQAFKRACVKFGLGAYLYRLPKVWAAYDEGKKAFTPAGLAELAKAVGGGNGHTPPQPAAELDQTFPRFGDGSTVPEAAVDFYTAYRDAAGKAPANLADLRTWAKAKGNGKR